MKFSTIHESSIPDLSVRAFVLVGIEHPGKERGRLVKQSQQSFCAPESCKLEVFLLLLPGEARSRPIAGVPMLKDKRFHERQPKNTTLKIVCHRPRASARQLQASCIKASVGDHRGELGGRDIGFLNMPNGLCFCALGCSCVALCVKN